jgi:hypothetical protein
MNEREIEIEDSSARSRRGSQRPSNVPNPAPARWARSEAPHSGRGRERPGAEAAAGVGLYHVCGQD